MQDQQFDEDPSARNRIVSAALAAYSELGFIGASTREIAKRADVSQGLLTYHFKSKNELWFAAVDQLFDNFSSSIGEAPFVAAKDNDKEMRKLLKKFMQYNAQNPHFLGFIVDAGKELNERSEYLIEIHVRPMYEQFLKLLPKALSKQLGPHVFYAWIGAVTTIYSVAAECERLTGVDPTTDESIDTHVDLISTLFLSASPTSILKRSLFKSLKIKL